MVKKELQRARILKSKIELLEDMALRIRAAVENPKPVAFDKLDIQQTPQNVFELTMIRLDEIETELGDLMGEYYSILAEFEIASEELTYTEANILRLYYFYQVPICDLLVAYNRSNEGHEINYRQMSYMIEKAVEKISSKK